MPTAARPPRLPRRLLELATGNWLARGYLAVFAASVLVMFLAPDSGFAAAPMLLTAPLSLLAVVLPVGPGTEGGGAAGVLAVGLWALWLLLCAFVNAALLGALLTRSATPEPPARPRPHVSRALLAPAVDNWLARGYLAVVAASLGFFLSAAYLAPDPGFAAIWPLMATAPLSIVAVLVAAPAEWATSLSWLSPLLFALGAALSGLFNAVLLGHLARTLRTREARPAS
ncbi:SCO4225 family membrane protein [Streptomyces sp. NPDC093568]|uniref:SCO4225 family membrane protein n=1 Tax=Streptomyces sp. NPDC093568 TaxID=3366041 RepID=UPI00382A400F